MPTWLSQLITAFNAWQISLLLDVTFVWFFAMWQTHTHTHNRLTVPEEKLTHSHPSWSSDILYQLPPFTTIHSILSVQFTCLTVLFDNLSTMWQSSYNFHEWRERRDITVFYTTCTALHCNTETLEATDNSEYRMLHPSHPPIFGRRYHGILRGIFATIFRRQQSSHSALARRTTHTRSTANAFTLQNISPHTRGQINTQKSIVNDTLLGMLQLRHYTSDKVTESIHAHTHLFSQFTCNCRSVSFSEGQK